MRFRSSASLLFIIILFEISAFGLLAFRDETFDYLALVIAGIMVFILLFQYLLLTRFFPNMDRYILIIANLFCAVGVIMLYRLNTDTGLKQLLFIGIGIIVMVVVMSIVRNYKNLSKPVIPYMILSVVLLASTLVLGRSIGGAKNWIGIGSFGVQPSEFVKILLILVLASYLGGRLTVSKIAIAGCFTLVCLGLLMLERDLGAALLYVGAFMVIFYAATNNLLLTAAGLVAAGGAAVVSYKLFSHVRVRVEVWKNPWISYETQGYQIVQGLMAIASGGFFGMGLGLGSPKVIPAYQTDYIFAVICEEFGIIFGIAIILFYLILVIRGAIIARGCRNKFYALLAFGCTALISMQSLMIIGGVIKMIPLTGVTLPFISSGGSSMVSCFALIGLLEGVAVLNGDQDKEELREAVGE